MNVLPKLQLLSPEQKNEVHRYSIRILEDTGISVESKSARDLFRRSGAVKIEDEVVYLSGELISHALSQAPSNIEVFKKTGEPAFQLGTGQGNDTYFGIGVTNTWFQNIENEEVELFTRNHMQHCAKLGDLLNNYEMVSTLGIPSDVPAHESDLFATLDLYANTSKPLVLLISGDKAIHRVFELLEFLHGDISTIPFCIPYVNPITPLVLNESTSDKMVASIQRNLPVMFSNYSMYGGTSPVTEGGTLALLNAELLAGLVFSQLIKEGSKIILGNLPAAFNMSTMGSYYTPTSYLLNLACAEMMSYYAIPHCGTSGSSNGRGADLLASGDLWLNHLSACMGKIGCAPFVGGNFDSLAFSPTTAVLSNHIIGEVRKFARGFALNEEAVNLQEIDRVGHGGDYFTSEQTLASMHEAEVSNAIWSFLPLDVWKKQGMPTAERELRDYTRELFSQAAKASEDALGTIKKGEDYISKSFS